MWTRTNIFKYLCQARARYPKATYYLGGYSHNSYIEIIIVKKNNLLQFQGWTSYDKINIERQQLTAKEINSTRGGKY